MAKYATGRRSLAISDRSGLAFPYTEMVREWNGSLVHISEFEPKHPQIQRRYNTADAIALQNTRVQKFQQPQTIGDLNPTFAPNDTTVASSGGKMMTIVNLSLPGDFGFGVDQTEFTGNGITTTVSSMVPQDPSKRNNKRQMDITIGKVTITT
tara:strand:- start:117 stop:575 length:459 start_codon:yes stop_codon:yes gene_type:complete